MRLLIFLLLVCSSVSAFAGDKICVLNFERELHPISQDLNKLRGNPDVWLKHESQPKDIVDCYNRGFDKIVIVAHALQFEAQDRVSLGYFLRLAEPDRSMALQKDLLAITKEIQRIESLPNFRHELARAHTAAKQGPIVVSNDIRRYNGLLKIKKRLLALASNEPYYKAHPVLSKSFEDLEQSLKRSRNRPPLQIALMSCQASRIQVRYDALVRMQQEGFLKLNLAPSNSFLSWLLGKEVTNYSRTWLEEMLVDQAVE